jgi:hypothetical protein
MSGGQFDYKQYDIGRIADEIEQMIRSNNSEELDEWGCRVGYQFTPETISRFDMAVLYLRLAQIYTHRIDWLVSGDDGEDSFHKRLEHDLNEYVTNREKND